MNKGADIPLSTPLTNSTNLSAAIVYSQSLNWSVFPIHYKTKVPITQNGFHGATTDIDQINEWWSKHPNAGIGLPTGKINNIIVMDIDPRNGGHVSFDRLIDDHEEIPHTVHCQTGGGGDHYYFKYDERVNKSNSKDYPGIDIQSNGKYVVLPPSTHPSGRTYEWEQSSKPIITEMAEFPPWLVKIYQKKEHAKGKFQAKPSSEYVRMLQGVSEGERNNTLMSLIGHLLARNINYVEAFEIVHMWNESRVSPPLDTNIVTTAFNNILKRELGKR